MTKQGDDRLKKFERLYRPEEAAVILGFDSNTIRRWLREGQIKGIKVTGQWRIKESELQRIHQGEEE